MLQFDANFERISGENEGRFLWKETRSSFFVAMVEFPETTFKRFHDRWLTSFYP